MTTAVIALPERRAAFEAAKCIYGCATLSFHGVPGFDVYNASIPFDWQGNRYIFGRVERRAEWARSWVRLFAESGKDAWTQVPDSMVYQMEDPYVAWVGEELVLGGTHVRYTAGRVDTYYGYFYRGTDLHARNHAAFTCRCAWSQCLPHSTKNRRKLTFRLINRTVVLFCVFYLDQSGEAG